MSSYTALGVAGTCVFLLSKRHLADRHQTREYTFTSDHLGLKILGKRENPLHPVVCNAQWQNCILFCEVCGQSINQVLRPRSWRFSFEISQTSRGRLVGMDVISVSVSMGHSSLIHPSYTIAMSKSSNPMPSCGCEARFAAPTGPKKIVV